MDPLVRLALATQQLIARTAGTLLAIGFGAFVVYAETERLDDAALYAVGGLFLVSLGYRIVQRRRRAPGRPAAGQSAESERSRR